MHGEMSSTSGQRSCLAFDSASRTARSCSGALINAWVRADSVACAALRSVGVGVKYSSGSCAGKYVWMRNTEGRVKFDSLPGEVTGRVEGLNNLKSESCGCSRPALCDGPTSEVCCRIEWTGELDIYLQKNTVSSTLVTGIRKGRLYHGTSLRIHWRVIPWT